MSYETEFANPSSVIKLREMIRMDLLGKNRAGAVVVLSGGQDSTTCLFWAKETFGSDNVSAVTFDYGQRHRSEIEAAKEIAKNFLPYGHHHIVDFQHLNRLTSNALTRSDIPIETTEAGTPSTFVDGRNMMFLTYSAIMAKQMDRHHIVTGVSQSDFSGYPDCRDVFIKSLNVSLNLAMNYDFVIHTPLMWLTKAETWGMADSLGCLEVVKNGTVTCYNGLTGSGCGTCPACVLRNRGLNEYISNPWNGVKK